MGSNRLESSYGKFSDEEMVRMATGGDQEAFWEVYRRYGPLLFGRAYRSLNDQHDAEDVVQDTFMVAWENLARLRHPDRFPGWLQGILGHKIKKVIRKRKKQKFFREKVVHLGDLSHKDIGKVPEQGKEDWYFIFVLLEKTVPKLVGKKIKVVAKFMFDSYRKSEEFPSVRSIEGKFNLSHGTAQRWRERVVEKCQQIASAHGFSLDL